MMAFTHEDICKEVGALREAVESHGRDIRDLYCKVDGPEGLNHAVTELRIVIAGLEIAVKTFNDTVKSGCFDVGHKKQDSAALSTRVYNWVYIAAAVCAGIGAIIAAAYQFIH